MTIYDEVTFFMEKPEQERFEALALRVFRHQFDTVVPYRNYCLGRGVRRDGPRSLGEVPAISTVAFKYAELAAGSPERIFLSSGTTAGREERGRHFVPRLGVYRASAIAHLRRMLFPDGRRLAMLALHPTADRMPESSLAQMISWCIEEFGAGSLSAADRHGVDLKGAVDFLRRIAQAAEPVCILGTTAAIWALYDALGREADRLRLAPGSRLMDTGGAKGQTIPLGSAEVVAKGQELLGIDPALIINEYGMSEMCSQLYDATRFNSDAADEPAERWKIAPPWLIASAVDPVTLEPVAEGRPGLLAFFDLANVGSVSALFTEDLGIVSRRRVRILGRSVGAQARGCALGIAEFAEREAARASAPDASGASRKGMGAGATPLSAAQLHARASELRAAIAEPLPRARIVEALATACDLWRDRGFTRRRDALAAIARSRSWSQALVEESLDELLGPFSRAALTSFAERAKAHPRLVGLITPGNIVGAGLHEFCQALLAGGALLVKTSTAEPIFFAELADTLADIAPPLARRVAVLSFGRDEPQLTAALKESCDIVAAMGSDQTISSLRGGCTLVGFGSRLSGAFIGREAASGPRCDITAAAVVRDVTLFEQQGCLSPHQVFVEDPDGGATREFCARLAFALERLCARLPAPGRLGLEDAAPLRGVREAARWRALGGRASEVWEGPSLSWAVIFGTDGGFHSSAGYRTVHVSPVANIGELMAQLELVRGRVEGFAVADPAGHLSGLERELRAMGVSWICAPGRMQAPPLDWAHGNGSFLRLMLGEP